MKTIDRSIHFDNESWKELCLQLTCLNPSPKAIVAVARKMPRILEYFGVTKKAPCQIITERALPWLDNNDGINNALVFCDDVLNVGTTLHYCITCGEDNGFVPVKAYVYASKNIPQTIKESTPLGKYDLTIKEVFSEKRYSQFETMLPQELLKIGKPYDIDFPIISVKISKEDAARTSKEWHDFFCNYFVSVNELTVNGQGDVGISSISITSPFSFNIEGAMPMEDNVPLQLLKVRIYISKREEVMRIVPICIFPASSSFLEEKKGIFSSEISDIFEDFSRKARSGKPFELEPVYNLFIFLASFEYGRHFLAILKKIILSISESDVSLSMLDLEFIFGRNIACELGEKLEILLHKKVSPVQANNPNRFPHVKKPFKEELVNEILERFSGSHSKANTGHIFNQAMEILDDIYECTYPDLKKGFPEYIRLRKGLSLRDIWFIVCKLHPQHQPSFEEMSFLLDYYVDLGIVVPVVERFKGIYLRTYRRGEPGIYEFMEFIHNLLDSHKIEYPNKPFMKTYLTKVITALAIFHPKLVPLVPVFRRYGRVTLLKDLSEGAIKKELGETLEYLSGATVIDALDEKGWRKRNSTTLPLFRK